MHTSFAARIFAFTLLAFAAISGNPGKAQTGRQMKVVVPFSFENGSTHFEAGVYTLHLEAGKQIMRIEGTHSSAFMLTLPDYTTKPSITSKVVFRRYGSQYFLKEVWVAGSSSYVHTPKSKNERELEIAEGKAKENTQNSLALVASSH